MVTYNSAHCIEDISINLIEFPNFIIIDNNSDDNTIEKVSRHLPNAKIIANTKNLGFGAATNIGLDQASTPYALLLNPDCEINSFFALKLIETAINFPLAPIVAPQLTDKHNRIDINYRWPKTFWNSRGPGAEGLCSVGFACGAALLINIKAISQVGFFDESFFLYYEDDDLCHRILNAKLSIILNPEVKLMHSSRGSVRGKHPLKSEFIRGFHHAQSKIYYLRKYTSNKNANYRRLITLIYAITSLPLRVIAFSPKLIARLLGRIIGLIRI